jgi:NTP pyrophosphatase (non-canonical NTP hydrolase)
MAGDSTVDFADYTGWVFSVFNRKDPKSDLMQAAMGLTGESCEIQENVKRFIFHDGTLDRIDMAMELGDVLFYFTLMLISNKLNLRDVMTASQTKLNVRYPNGRDGDNFVVNKNHDKEKQAVAIALNSSI